MKRVVVYGVKTFPSRGGTDRVAENLVIQLKEEFPTTVYCYSDPEAENHIKGIRVIQFKPISQGAIGAFVYFFMSAIHLLFQKNVGVVHVHKTDAAFFVPLLKIRHKVVATSHEAPYKRDKWNKFVKLYFHLVERIFIKSSDQCSCISQPLTDYYKAKYGKEVLFVPNGINLVEPEQFDVKAARSFLPDGASLDKPYVLFSARRLMGTKGCHTMLEALAKINYQGQVFIAGELHHNSDYLEKLKKLASGLNVYFLGYVYPLNTLLALVDHADLFIFPSETEGMSIMLLEVASVGKPIVASDIPENTQVFSGNEVLYFKNMDAGDLAEKLTYALGHKEEMRALGKRCQQRVYADYLWTNIARTYATVYKSIMK
jgi:glycosyltransferase involved in cell wall biosynthesis